MAEMTRSREEHRDIVLVAGGNGVGIVLGATGLNDGGYSGFRGLIDAVPEGEKGIRCEDRSLAPITRLVSGDVNGIDTAHLTGTDADEGVVPGKNDRVRFDVLDAPPGEFESLQFFKSRLTVGDDLPIGGRLSDAVEILNEESARYLAVIEAA